MKLFLVFFVSVLSGCFPYALVDQPQIQGRIVDSKGHAPLQDVKISAPLHGTANSGADGDFRTPPLYTLGIYIIPTDPWRKTGPVVFSKSGYGILEKTVTWTALGPHTIKLGTIDLKRTTQPEQK